MSRITDNQKKTSSTVKNLKKKYSNIPSHFLFSIKDPLEFQCPLIDENIEKITKCKDLLNKAFNAKSLDTKNAHILSALYSISNLDTHLDEIMRSNFENLREYSGQWKKLAIEALDASGDPEKFVKIKWK